MEELADTAEDLVTYLQFHLDGAISGTEPAQVAGSADAACTYFQGVGICELLLDAEVDAFFQHMIRSGRMRRWLLRKAQGKEDYPAKLLKPSNARGLFAALAANDWDLAAEIARLSPQTWNERIEYEDDFCYAHFLHRFLLGDDRATLAGLLGQYARALDGDEPPRYRLCASLLAAKADAEALASAAFEELLEERRKQLETMREKSILATDELFAPLSAVYVEGLAWLRLLERAGLSTRGEYVFCPSLARATQFAPVPAGVFPP